MEDSDNIFDSDESFKDSPKKKNHQFESDSSSYSQPKNKPKKSKNDFGYAELNPELYGLRRSGRSKTLKVRTPRFKTKLNQASNLIIVQRVFPRNQ